MWDNANYIFLGNPCDQEVRNYGRKTGEVLQAVVGSAAALKVASKLKPLLTSIQGISKANFGSAEKLAEHFAKHGDEFKGVYKNADEYLEGARDVMQNGTKVSYTYKDEIRTGYLRFMGNNSKGVAKFEFVGTNNLKVAERFGRC